MSCMGVQLTGREMPWHVKGLGAARRRLCISGGGRMRAAGRQLGRGSPPPAPLSPPTPECARACLSACAHGAFQKNAEHPRLRLGARGG